MINWSRNYWEDHCPTCGELAIEGCRCPLNDRRCKNGHWWRRRKDGAYAILEKGHQEVSEEDWKYDIGTGETERDKIIN